MVADGVTLLVEAVSSSSARKDAACHLPEEVKEAMRAPFLAPPEVNNSS
jgi:hypothetical protein